MGPDIGTIALYAAESRLQTDQRRLNDGAMPRGVG
jgi:hypothetical protein